MFDVLDCVVFVIWGGKDLMGEKSGDHRLVSVIETSTSGLEVEKAGDHRLESVIVPSPHSSTQRTNGDHCHADVVVPSVPSDSMTEDKCIYHLLPGTDFPKRRPKHALRRGFDVGDISTFTLATGSDLPSVIETCCIGRRFIWTFDQIGLRPYIISNRFKVQTSREVMMQSSCVTNLSQGGQGCTVAYSLKHCKQWSFGIVHSITYCFDNQVDGDLISLLKWKGGLDDHGRPNFSSCNDSESVLRHFQCYEYHPDEIDLYFVNFISGKLPMGMTIASDTTNPVDGGAQCSKNGPDVWNLGLPRYRSCPGPVFPSDFEFDVSDNMPDPVIIPNPILERERYRRVVRKSINTIRDDQLRQFAKPPKRSMNRKQLCIVVVVEQRDGNPVTPKHCNRVPPSLKDRFVIGSPKELTDSNKRTLYCLSKKALKDLHSFYPDGVDIVGNAEDQLERILKIYSDREIELLDLSNITPPVGEKKWNGFYRLFAGQGRPPVDKTFHQQTSMGFDLRFKFVDGDKFADYVPLDIGFFQSHFHGIKITQSIVEKINKVTGGKGTFSSRNCMGHTGELFYAGPRKGSMKGTPISRPSVSEGPGEKGYRYHRDFIRHAYWPFLLKLFSYLGGITSVASHWFYSHLARFYPFSNDVSIRDKFCFLDILTVNFACSCHCDRGDLDPRYEGEVKSSLNHVIGASSIMDERHMVSVQERAANALRHIDFWGLCTPTTCCYQFVQKDLDRPTPTVYQWFVCAGIGTCYRIQNFWTHIMLAGLFVHCTSVPIFVVGSKAYIGKCPHTTAFAWGKG